MRISGVVVCVNDTNVNVRDLRRKKVLRIPKGLAVPMTADQVSEYNSTPKPGDPHPQEICKRRLEVQMTWRVDDQRGRKLEVQP